MGRGAVFDEMVREDLDVSIDENNLLAEWQKQATLMLEYSVHLADAMQDEDEAKAALSVVDAELDSKIRADPDDYGLAKATESAVANAIAATPEHEAATVDLNDARHGVRMLRAAVDAISHRKSALQGMTDLFLRQWYADPTSAEQPAELRDATKNTAPMKTTERRKRRRTKKTE